VQLVLSRLQQLQQLQQTATILQVLEQLQQQQLGSPGRPTQTALQTSSTGGGSSSSGSITGFGQQPLFRPRNAAQDLWRQQLSQRRAGAVVGHLFLDDLLQQLQQQARLADDSPALQYPYPDVLTCVSTLFAGSSGGSGDGVWHARLAVLLYYLLDGGWLGSAEPFAHVSAGAAPGQSIAGVHWSRSLQGRCLLRPCTSWIHASVTHSLQMHRVGGVSKPLPYSSPS
jgi:hypothetical protein